MQALNDFLWGRLLIAALLAIGLVLSARTRLVQFRYFSSMFSLLGGALQHQGNHLSTFQALVLSVAGRVGAGNIAGVAVAISLGGPGAVFWMWITGLIRMATSFFECTIAQVFKTSEHDGTYRGGPAYYIERGIGLRWMGVLFSILLLLTFGLGFNALQSFTVASAVADTFGVPAGITGAVLMVVLGVVIFGGVRRIAEVAELVVPFMAVGYFLLALVTVIIHLDQVPRVLADIFSSAFGLRPALGGGLGAALLFGVKRGLFSNEAGLGSAPNVAAVAYVKHPVEQGIIQAFSVFIDTLVLCSCTAFLILTTPLYQPGSAAVGVTLTQQSIGYTQGWWGQAFITVALVLFAFTSMIYNYYLGENALNYFSDSNQKLFSALRLVTLVLIIWGASQDLATVFGFADITMGLLALVNLVALVALMPVGLRVLHDYERQRRLGQVPVFCAADHQALRLDPLSWPGQP
jgi:amino acid carrier protein